MRSALLRFAFLLLLLAVPMAGAAPEEPEEPEAEVPDHSEEEVQEAREEFESIDTNKDGYISREEILEMDEVPERDEIDEFFNTYDTNGDGRVTFEEILHADSQVRSDFFFLLRNQHTRHSLSTSLPRAPLAASRGRQRRGG